MAKQVFRPNEIAQKENEKKFSLPLIHDYAPPPVVEEVKEEVYEGPTADELRREAEAYKKGWEIEKQHMFDEAQKAADEIVKNAEATASEVVANAHAEADRIVAAARAEEEKIRSEAHETAYKEGYDQGYANGQEEVNRLIERIHRMIEGIMVRREQILKETEQQIVELVILITRKVVKVIADTQKTTIINNILAALKKVKARGKVTLRVNIEDLKLASVNAGEFIKRVENVEGIEVIEDSTVDRGGCIVETDFGAIDARIASQLGELESKILEVSPVKSISKTPSLSE